MTVPSYAVIGISEFIGTFFLVYVVALCVTLAPFQSVTPIAIGGAIFGLCNIFGDITGAHFNPCITLAVFCTDSKFTLYKAFIYVTAQIAGAVSAVQVSSWNANNQLVNPFSWSVKPFTISQLMFCEAAFTAMLCLTALRAGFLKATPQSLTPVWVAGTVVAASYAGGPLSGACINPALSVAWVVANGSPWDLIPYVVGPLVGSLFAVAFCLVSDGDLWYQLWNLQPACTKQQLPTTNLGERLATK